METRGITVYRRSTKEMHAWLSRNSQASAGPYPSITGMRNKYWGRNAQIVRCGRFIYLVRDAVSVPQL